MKPEAICYLPAEEPDAQEASFVTGHVYDVQGGKSE